MRTIHSDHRRLSKNQVCNFFSGMGVWRAADVIGFYEIILFETVTLFVNSELILLSFGVTVLRLRSQQFLNLQQYFRCLNKFRNCH